jgi:hypothetical protein
MKKIALMSSWNAACGISIHAELIGREFIKEGHKLRVFAPLSYEDDHTYLWFHEDEEFVNRTFSFLRYGNKYKDEKLLSSLYLDPSFVEKEDFNFFIVEKPSSIPLNKLLPLFKKIKKKAKTIAILHEGILPKNPYFFKFDWDKIVVFDERYERLFSKVFPPESIHIVPFPCYIPTKQLSKKKAREALNLDEDEKILFSYGRFYFLREVLEKIEKIREDYKIKYLCMVRSIEKYKELSILEKKFPFFEVRLSRYPIFSDEFHHFIFSSDAIIFYRKSALHNPVSSSAHICLGFERPLICPDNEFFYTFKNNEVIKYKSVDEINEKIINAIENKDKVLEKAKEFIERNSAKKIARKILNL